MSEIRAKVRALIALGDNDLTADLIIDVVARCLGRLGGRPTSDLTFHKPVTKPQQNVNETPSHGGVRGGNSDPIYGSDPDRIGSLIGKSSRVSSNMSLPPTGFSEFWALYPRHVAKAAAIKAWIKIDPTSDLTLLILEAIRWQAPVFRSREPERVPHASTWLNGRRWQDEKPATSGAHNAPQASPLDAYCEFHREVGHDSQASFRPKESCPSCKHLRAKNRPREDTDPMPLWAGSDRK